MSLVKITRSNFENEILSNPWNSTLRAEQPNSKRLRYSIGLENTTYIAICRAKLGIFKLSSQKMYNLNFFQKDAGKSNSALSPVRHFHSSAESISAGHMVTYSRSPQK